jgi:hypothetical protein
LERGLNFTVLICEFQTQTPCLVSFLSLLSINEQKHLALNIFVTWRLEQGETREREVVGPPVVNFGKGCKKELPGLDFWYPDHNT